MKGIQCPNLLKLSSVSQARSLRVPLASQVRASLLPIQPHPCLHRTCVTGKKKVGSFPRFTSCRRQCRSCCSHRRSSISISAVPIGVICQRQIVVGYRISAFALKAYALVLISEWNSRIKGATKIFHMVKTFRIYSTLLSAGAFSQTIFSAIFIRNSNFLK